MQFHFDPTRESNPHALPDGEVFYLSEQVGDDAPGYYWQACFPGCLPDGDAVGPFDTMYAAVTDAQNF